MTEVFEPPLYFAWEMKNGLPYLQHVYVQKAHRSIATTRAIYRRLKSYFHDLGATHILMNAMCTDKRAQRIIEYFCKVKPYSEADDHKFYMVEV